MIFLSSQLYRHFLNCFNYHKIKSCRYVWNITLCSKVRKIKKICLKHAGVRMLLQKIFQPTYLLFSLSPDTFHHITRNGSKLLWSKQPKWDEIIFEVALFSFCVKIHLFFSNKIAYKTTSTVVSEKTLTQNEL